MEVNFEYETEVGDVEIECPLCKDHRCEDFKDDKRIILKMSETIIILDSCPLCNGEGVISVWVGNTLIQVDSDIDVEPMYNEGYD